MTTEQINMMMQLMMQQSQVSSSNAGKDSNGDSFQDLMLQKQDAVSDKMCIRDRYDVERIRPGDAEKL